MQICVSWFSYSNCSSKTVINHARSSLCAKGCLLLGLREIVVSGKDALQVADALTSTSLKVLHLLSKERLDVSTIAERLKLSQPYVSELIRRLEESNLVKVEYQRGERGVRKICELAVEKVVIIVKP